MSEVRTPAAEQEHRDLDEEELATWLPVIRFVQLLPQVLDRSLKDEVGLNHARYAILVTLAGRHDQDVTMTELAHVAGLSRSRLSHALDALEQRGWVQRTSCSSDKRTLSATLTPEGRAVLRDAAPVHIEQVRRLVLDPLTPAEREQLGTILGKLLPEVTAAL